MKDTIARVLRNPLYVGLIIHGEERFPGDRPPLIDESTYQARSGSSGSPGARIA